MAWRSLSIFALQNGKRSACHLFIETLILFNTTACLTGLCDKPNLRQVAFASSTVSNLLRFHSTSMLPAQSARRCGFEESKWPLLAAWPRQSRLWQQYTCRLVEVVVEIVEDRDTLIGKRVSENGEILE